TGAEGRVERTIAVVTRQREALASVEIGVASRDNLPVRLDDGRRRLGTDPESSRHDATCAETGVERAVGVEACEREVSEKVDGRSHRDKLPVRLLDNGKHPVKIAWEIENGGHFATRAEAGVDRALAVTACQPEVEGTVEAGQPSDETLPVRLHGNGTRRGTGASREIGGHFATCAETCVQPALSERCRSTKQKAQRRKYCFDLHFFLS